ncbi:MAG: hypothetical protein MZU84_04335 [Sphingobacterium sp.]|nr:hypothetical protein [Sphingobacterium sp.]
MRLPIQYAFSLSRALERPAAAARPRALRRGSTSPRPDHKRFPCLGLAYRALGGDSSLPVVLNAANEVAVAAFLGGQSELPLDRRGHRVRRWTRNDAGNVTTLDDVRRVDRWAREFAQALIRDYN